MGVSDIRMRLAPRAGDFERQRLSEPWPPERTQALADVGTRHDTEAAFYRAPCAAASSLVAKPFQVFARPPFRELFGIFKTNRSTAPER